MENNHPWNAVILSDLYNSVEEGKKEKRKEQKIGKK
jgi:hypothetical protein